MADVLEIAKQYQALQLEGKIDEAAAFLADDVSFTNPMTGTVSGKEAVVTALKNRPADGPGATITWREPELSGDDVKIVGDGSPFGPVRILFSFSSDLISKIDIGLGS